MRRTHKCTTSCLYASVSRWNGGGMATAPTYPGVYIEELPSSVRTITAVSTSVAAFVGYTRRGQLSAPVVLTSFADFERRFGGLSAGGILGYAVQQFFLNGGSTAIIVRLASGGQKSTSELAGGGANVLRVTARDAGAWADGLRVRIDNDTATPNETFNLHVADLAGTKAESFRDLSMARGDPRFVEPTVNGSSALITATALGD